VPADKPKTQQELAEQLNKEFPLSDDDIREKIKLYEKQRQALNRYPDDNVENVSKNTILDIGDNTKEIIDDSAYSLSRGTAMEDLKNRLAPYGELAMEYINPAASKVKDLLKEGWYRASTKRFVPNREKVIREKMQGTYKGKD